MAAVIWRKTKKLRAAIALRYGLLLDEPMRERLREYVNRSGADVPAMLRSHGAKAWEAVDLEAQKLLTAREYRR